MADRLISEAEAIDALRKELPGGCSGRAEYIIEKLPTAQPEVQLSPIEQALHGLSPEEQEYLLRKLMRKARDYTDSRAALIRWLKEGKWN